MTAPTSPDYALTPTEGIDFTQTYTISASTPEYPNAPFLPGMHVLGTDGTEYMFVKASTAIVQWAAVAIDTTQAAAVPATWTLVNEQTELGWAQVAIAAGSYGWVALRGNGIGVLAKKGSLAATTLGPAANPNGKLYISSTSPGVLTTTSVRTSALVSGIVLTTSCTSAMLTTVNSVSGPVVANASWPRGLL